MSVGVGFNDNRRLSDSLAMRCRLQHDHRSASMVGVQLRVTAVLAIVALFLFQSTLGQNVNATSITAGQYHACGLLSNGSVMCWGYNRYGQMGDGTSTLRTVPAHVLLDSTDNITVTAVSAGYEHTCVLLSDTTVMCWGTNQHGQLGDGTQSDRAVPVLVTNVSGAVTVSAGGHHSCSVLSNATATSLNLKCWGYNGYGQLGRTTTINELTNVPEFVPGLAGVVLVATGELHTCALLSNGTVLCWGYNGSGQIGVGAASNNAACTCRSTPTVVSGLSLSQAGVHVVALAAGRYHTCSVLSDGIVNCWGNNGFSQLGDGAQLDKTSPVAVMGLTNVVSISASFYHTCSALTNGSVRCWGWNLDGQLGDGTTSDSANGAAPAVFGLAGVVGVAAGGYHSCALVADGGVQCWGTSLHGELGDGTTTGKRVPVSVLFPWVSPSSTPSVASSISTSATKTATISPTISITSSLSESGSLSVSATPTAAVSVASSVLATSSTSATRSVSPTPAASIAQNFKSIFSAGGGSHSCAVFTDGTAMCWGQDWWGQLRGNGFANGALGCGCAAVPVDMSGFSSVNVVSMGLGSFHSCGLQSDGIVRCWGYNNEGQLGDGTLQYRFNASVGVTGLSTVVAVAAQMHHTCALLANGTVKCWGWNMYWQLGRNTVGDPAHPTVSQADYVTGLTNATAITVGELHSCALLTSGNVTCWGYGGYGQLGDGYLNSVNTLVQVAGVADVIAISSGRLHSCAVMADGAMKCWGNNNYGQIGDGTTSSDGCRCRPYPVSVVGLTSALASTGGREHTCAVVSDGAVMCWGRNDDGQLGCGTTADANIPQRVLGVSGAVVVAAGEKHTCSLQSDKSVKCWGNNEYGSLGDGSVTSALIPVAVLFPWVTPSSTPSVSASSSITPTPTRTTSATLSSTKSASITGSTTSTISITSSLTASKSITISVTGTVSVTAQPSASATASRTSGGSESSSRTSSTSPAASDSPSSSDSTTPWPAPSPECGNGIVEVGEGCDTGGVEGCSSSCQAELGWTCVSGVFQDLPNTSVCVYSTDIAIVQVFTTDLRLDMPFATVEHDQSTFIAAFLHTMVTMTGMPASVFEVEALKSGSVIVTLAVRPDGSLTEIAAALGAVSTALSSASTIELSSFGTVTVLSTSSFESSPRLVLQCSDGSTVEITGVSDVVNAVCPSSALANAIKLSQSIIIAIAVSVGGVVIVAVVVASVVYVRRRHTKLCVFQSGSIAATPKPQPVSHTPVVVFSNPLDMTKRAQADYSGNTKLGLVD